MERFSRIPCSFPRKRSAAILSPRRSDTDNIRTETEKTMEAGKNNLLKKNPDAENRKKQSPDCGKSYPEDGRTRAFQIPVFPY